MQVDQQRTDAVVAQNIYLEGLQNLSGELIPVLSQQRCLTNTWPANTPVTVLRQMARRRRLPSVERLP